MKKDFFREKSNIKHTGSHLIIDIYGAINLSDISFMKDVFVECIEKCGATLLGSDFHNFEPNGGISGIAVLSESHISVHTWPEYNYAAFDVFMCGAADTMKAVDVIKERFKPQRVEVNEFLRGQGIFNAD
jgi:S-adenosylmethionine decarboxylase